MSRQHLFICDLHAYNIHVKTRLLAFHNQVLFLVVSFCCFMEVETRVTWGNADSIMNSELNR